MSEEPVWREIALRQAGLISREQLLDLGVSVEVARGRISRGTWSRVVPGIFDTMPTGRTTSVAAWERGADVDPVVRLWTGVLQAGPGSAVGGTGALWLSGVVDTCPRTVHIEIPAGREIKAIPGIQFHQRSDLRDVVHPTLLPPRLRIEAAVVDVADSSRTIGTMIDVVLRSVQRRRTTADRLRDEVDRRSRHSRRGLLLELLSDAASGVESPLELRYLKDVERAHGLPPSKRNALDRRTGQLRYRDFWYPEYGLVVEVDGREAHPLDEDFRDRRRDNAVELSGDSTLRYGWRDVAPGPCQVAAQVGAVLIANGWPGSPTPCGPACQLS